MKIVVTGGAGFIGSHIVDNYINLRHKVWIIDNLSTGKKENINPEAEFVNLDIRDSKKVNEFFSSIKPNILSHHAAQLDVRKSVSDPVYDAEVNIIGLLNLLEAGKANNLKKVIFASSGGVVYGDARVIPTSETYHPLRPISPYGVAKLTSENYLYYYNKAYKIPYIALRYANVYGPRQDPHGEAGVVAIFTEKFLKNESAVINGDGKQTRDYVFVEDVAKANILSLENDFVGSINIGTGKETSVNTIYSILKKLTKSTVSEKHGAAKIGEQQRSALDIEMTKKTLQWGPTVDLEEGLAKTVEFFQQKNQ